MLALIVNTGMVGKSSVQSERPAAPSNDAEVQDACAFQPSNAKTWPQLVMSGPLPVLEKSKRMGQFVLDDCPGAVACNLYPISQHFESLDPELQENVQLVFSGRTGGMTLKNCKFEGRKTLTDNLRRILLHVVVLKPGLVVHLPVSDTKTVYDHYVDCRTCNVNVLDERIVHAMRFQS